MSVLELSEKTGSVRPLHMTKLVQLRHAQRRSFQLIVHGETGLGKTIATIRLLAQVKGTWDLVRNPDTDEKEPVLIQHNWDAWKEFMTFHPKDTLQAYSKQADQDDAGEILVQDDAGYWLSNQDWSDDFLKEVSNVKNLGRTVFATEAYTTPDKDWLLKRVRAMPGQYTGKVIVATGNPYGTQPYKRILKGHKVWRSEDGKRSGSELKFKDHFRALLPPRVFKEYHEVRKKYAVLAIRRMRESYDEAVKRGKFGNWESELLKTKATMLTNSISREEAQVSGKLVDLKENDQKYLEMLHSQ